MNKFENLYPFYKSVQGASHIKAENESKSGRKFPCQDYSYSEYIVPENSSSISFYFSTVCDGHGSAPHFRSQKGAEFAGKSLLESIKYHIDKIVSQTATENIKTELKNIAQYTHDIWKKKLNTI